MFPSVFPRLATDSARRVFPGVWKPLFLKFPSWDRLPFPGRSSLPTSFVSFFVFYIFSYLFLKTVICFSGCLMSSASIQKLFCGVCSALKCSFDEFVREKVVSPSYSSAILVPPSHLLFHKKHFPAFKVVSRKTQQDSLSCCELHSPWKWKILGLILYFIIYLMCSTDRHYLTFLYLLFFNLSSYFSTLLILLPLL